MLTHADKQPDRPRSRSAAERDRSASSPRGSITAQLKAGTPVNDDPHLEREADLMGTRAASLTAPAQRVPTSVQVTARVAQLVTADELAERGAAIAAIGQLAPEESMNLWVATNAQLGATIHLLGTMHSLRLAHMKEAPALVDYLSQNHFTHVYSEIATDISRIQVKSPDRMKELLGDVANGVPTREGNKPAFIKYHRNISDHQDIASPALDDIYGALALAHSDSDSSKQGGRTLGLETDEGLRAEASAQNDTDLPGKHGKPVLHDSIEPAIKAGNQKHMFAMIAERMQSGHDYEDTEERNKRWIQTRVTTHGAIRHGDNQLWIVGASHLPGLVLRLAQAGWVVTTAGKITNPNDGHGPGHVDRVTAGGVTATRTRL